MKRPLMTAALALALSACTLSVSPLPQRTATRPPPIVAEIKEAARAEETRVEELKEKVEEKLEQKVEKVEQKVEHKVEAARAFVLEEFLDALAREHETATGEMLDWRGSVVDLFKAIGFDSSLPARRELAAVFANPRRYRGTAADNAWLHAHVIAWLRGE